MINENNINKYGEECYKKAYEIIQKLRGQDLFIIKELRESTGVKLADAKNIIADIQQNENAYREYLFRVEIVGSTDSII